MKLNSWQTSFYLYVNLNSSLRSESSIAIEIKEISALSDEKFVGVEKSAKRWNVPDRAAEFQFSILFLYSKLCSWQAPRWCLDQSRSRFWWRSSISWCLILFGSHCNRSVWRYVSKSLAILDSSLYRIFRFPGFAFASWNRSNNINFKCSSFVLFFQIQTYFSSHE